MVLPKIPEMLVADWTSYQSLLDRGLRKPALKKLDKIIEKTQSMPVSTRKEFLYSFYDSDLTDFHRTPKIQFPFFERCVLPLLLQGLERSSAREINYLVRSRPCFHGDQMEKLNRKYENEGLLLMALKNDPNNKETVNLLMEDYLRFLDFGAHHLPDSLVIDLNDAKKVIQKADNLLETHGAMILPKLVRALDHFKRVYRLYSSWLRANTSDSFKQWSAEAELDFTFRPCFDLDNNQY